jgi:chromosome segregation ATPase
MPPNGVNPFQGMRDAIYGNEREHPGSKGGQTVPPDQEDAREMLQRIQEAIPDINRLLGTFKHTKTKLQSREAEFKQLESQHKQALMHKEFFIEALQNQLRKTANEGAEEASKLKNMINELRMELGNLEEKRKDLEEKLADSDGVIKTLEEGKADYEDQIKKLNANMEEERVAHGQALEKQREEKDAEKEEALTTQKHELTELFEEIKAEDEKAAAETLAAREAELQEQQEAMKTEYEQQKQQMQESHNTLQAEFDSKLTELASTKDELEQKHQELEDTRKSHAEEIESLENSHLEKVTEMGRVWNEEKTGLETQLAERTDELANSERENKRLEEDVLSKEKQLEHSVDSMRVTIDNLDKDCDRLRKTLHSLGEATDLKNTKGDTFL